MLLVNFRRIEIFFQPMSVNHNQNTLALLDSWKLIEYLSVFSTIDKAADEYIPNPKGTKKADSLNILHDFTPQNLERLIALGNKFKVEEDRRPKKKSYKKEKEEKEKHFGIKVILLPFEPTKVYARLAKHFEDGTYAESASSEKSYLAEFSFQTDDMALNEFHFGLSGIPSAMKAVLNGSYDFDYIDVKQTLFEQLNSIWRREDEGLISKVHAFVEELRQVWDLQFETESSIYVMLIDCDSPPQNIVPSFFAGDLQLLKRMEHGQVLQSYLAKTPTSERRDLSIDTDHVREMLAASKIPAGSWPTSYSLSLMQQFAVNNILALADQESGLFAVNGPPGTGKTTMLKDAFAALIVKRAQMLVTVEDPTKAFEKAPDQAEFKNGYKSDWYKLDPKVSGYEMIVASSNNSAVENLSKELPQVDPDYVKRHGEYPEDLHFESLGEYLLNFAKDEGAEMLDAWNFLSFPLGNKKNRWKYTHIFKGNKRNKNAPEREGIEGLLKGIKVSKSDWKEAVKAFEKTIAQWENTQSLLTKWEKFLEEPKLNNWLHACNYDVVSRVAELEGELEILAEKMQEFRDAFDNEGFEKDMRYRTLQKSHEELNTEHEQLSTYRNFSKEYAQNLPDTKFWKSAFNAGKSSAQAFAPWMSESLKVQSVEVFFAALRVHRAFVGRAKVAMSKNLMLILNTMTGSNCTPEMVKHGWQTLFLLTPVISTTFASASNLFEKMGKETFGWLFIDEAGQAVPQAAAGSIWRCKRVVAVGDLLQIEPVVPIPPKAFDWFAQRLSETEGKTFLKIDQSVQTFADEASHLGVELKDGLWVGSPLRVHRRCQSPMFEISNRIAYNGLMQQANWNNHEHPLGPSRFINKPGAASQGQWVKEQTDAAILLLENYIAQNAEPDVFVISPFNTVVNNFRKHLRARNIDFANRMKGRIGTVHKFQGKETNVVVLILGCDQSRTGAVKWACDRPNILNVAVTRAKQAIIVIGDDGLWGGHFNFDVLLGEVGGT